MMEESESIRKESRITFPPMKAGTTRVNEEREELSLVNSSLNPDPGYSKNPQNESLINSISTLINTRLTEFRSEMITMINKNGDNLCLQDFETNILTKGEKCKTGDTHSNDLSGL